MDRGERSQKKGKTYNGEVEAKKGIEIFREGSSVRKTETKATIIGGVATEDQDQAKVLEDKIKIGTTTI